MSHRARCEQEATLGRVHPVGTYEQARQRSHRIGVFFASREKDSRTRGSRTLRHSHLRPKIKTGPRRPDIGDS
jgi:truncated hemoglobin YjbI